MTTRSMGKIGSARLMMGLLAILMVAVVACSSDKTDEQQPATVTSGNQPQVTATATSEPAGGDSAVIDADASADQSSTAAGLDAAIDQATGALFLEMLSPMSKELFVTQSSYEFSGRTTVDALLSVNDYVLDVDEQGRFAFEVDLEIGPNVIEVIASNALGEQHDEVLLVIYEPV